jgi:hypothetical protein
MASTIESSDALSPCYNSRSNVLGQFCLVMPISPHDGDWLKQDLVALVLTSTNIIEINFGSKNKNKQYGSAAFGSIKFEMNMT